MNVMTPWGRGGREPHPELFDPPAAAPHTGGPTTTEAARYARDRHRALCRVRHARRRLLRLGTRLITARLAAEAAPVPGPRPLPDACARGLGIPPWFTGALMALIAAIEFLFWLTLGRQSVRYDDYLSPAALQAVALALVFPAAAIAGAVLAAPVARLPLLPIGTRQTWHRGRAAIGLALVAAMSVGMGVTAFTRFAADNAEIGARPLPVLPLALAFGLLPIIAMAVHAFGRHPDEEVRDRAERARRRHHRAATALEMELDRLIGGYHRDVAGSDVATLRGRAGHGQTGPYPPLATAPAGVADVMIAAPVSWLDVPVPPALQHAIVPSLRVLRDNRPRVGEVAP